LAKLKDFIKNKGTSISRSSNAPSNLRNSYKVHPTGNRNTRIESELEFFPLLEMTGDGHFNFIVWSNSNSFGESEHPGISGFQFELPTIVRFKKFDVWNTIQKTWWASTTYTDWTAVPHSDWPKGTIPQMMNHELHLLYNDLQESHTTFCAGNSRAFDVTEGHSFYNGWDALPTIDINYCEDGTPIYDFSIIGHNGSNGNVATFAGNACADGNSPSLFVPGQNTNGTYRVVRLENIKLAYQMNNLFNQCFSGDDIKVFDANGLQYPTEDIKGLCTADLFARWEYDLSTFDGRERACDYLGGILCRDDDNKCVFNERFCNNMMDPTGCNCQTFNCRQCFDNVTSATDNNLCCRSCCGYGHLPIDDLNDGENTSISGCTDVRACNYWSMATDDDGSCTYPADFGWCDCNGNVLDECGQCGGNGIEWGQNQSVNIEDIQIYPNTGCCSESDLRTVYFDIDCNGTGDGNYPFMICADNISSRDTLNYCLQITNQECANCFVQSSNQNFECSSGAIDCLGLCDGNSTISENTITGQSQCCTDLQKDKCGVCFGDNSLCTCNPDFIGDNVSIQKEKDISSTNGCVCGCTDKKAANFNPNANWPCGNKKEDNMCFDSERPNENACCWYWPNSLPDDDMGNCNNGEVELWGTCYNIENTTHLYLQYKDEVTGEIPSSIGNLTNLRTLALQGNDLTGEIPSSIGDLTNLQYLNLFENQLTGVIPEEICNQGDSYPSVYNNKLCPPYPECISQSDIDSQDTLNCGKIKLDLYSK
jgi:hypothetical protein